jgi:hypothetical protein
LTTAGALRRFLDADPVDAFGVCKLITERMAIRVELTLRGVQIVEERTTCGTELHQTERT